MSTAARAPRLSITDLGVAFPTPNGFFLAVAGLTLSINDGEVFGLVGESGSGKSVSCRAIIGLVPPPGAVIAGRINFAGRDLRTLPRRELRRVRAHEIGVVFQDPFNSLNPVYTVGQQLMEVMRHTLHLRRRKAQQQSIELLSRVGIPGAAKRMNAYPHELSGGMRQRVSLALALAPQPRLLVADEPTTALDVTVQDQILHLLLDIRNETGLSILLVSHDMGVIAQTCDTVAVMYAGRIVEIATATDLFARPRHPYTRALLDAVPDVRLNAASTVRAIPGQPPDLRALPTGCPFAPRCPFARADCAGVSMELLAIEASHSSACPFVDASAVVREAVTEAGGE